MSFLRFASLAILAVWVGGLAVLGAVAAPVIFATLEAHDPIAGRTLAGVLFGDIFLRFQHLAWILGGVLILSLGARAALGPRPRRFGVQAWLAIAMLAASLVSGLWIVPRIEAIRRAATTSITALPETDPQRVLFGRLHGWSNGLMGFSLVAGLGLLWLNARE